jgi:outer membrane protein assembly factor BamB
MYTVLRPNGDLLVISKGNYIARLNWHSKPLWKQKLAAHHDLTVAPDGNIYVLTHHLNRYPFDGVKIPIVDDYIVVVSPEGKVLRRTALFPLLRRFVDPQRLAVIKSEIHKGRPVGSLTRENAPSDTTHTNSIQVLENAIPEIAPAGAVLLSVREINRIVILDSALTEVLWSYGEGTLEEQHHATLQQSGNITIFDNGVIKKRSRLLEINPHTQKIVWSFVKPGFYTRLRGAMQKLPNGNVLATESDKGHVFEITPEGEEVWAFSNPDTRDTSGNTEAPGIIYRMMRYPVSYLEKELLKAED